MNTTFSTDSTDCSIEHVVTAIQQRKKPSPATLSDIRKALPKPIQPTPQILEQLLLEGIRDGRIWEYSDKKNQTVYWTESPFQMAAKKVNALLAQGDQKEAALQKKMISAELTGRVDPADVLSRLVSERQIFALPASSPSAHVEYSLTPLNVDDITTAAWQQVETKLQEQDRKSSELKSTLKTALRGVLEHDEFLRALIADRKVYLIAGEIGKPSAIYSLRPIDAEAAKQKAWSLIEQKLRSKNQTEPQLLKLIEPVLKGVIEPNEYLRSQVAAKRLFLQPGKSTTFGLKPVDHTPAVQKLVASLVTDLQKLANKTGMAFQDLFEICVSQLRSGVSEGPAINSSQTLSAQTTSSPRPAGIDQPVKDRILATLHKVNPHVEDGELVLVRQLRHQDTLSDIAKSDFDRMMLEMFRDRLIVLSRQSTGHVSDADRQDLVTDSQGNFYNTVALWRD